MNIYYSTDTKTGTMLTPKMFKESNLDGLGLQIRPMKNAIVTISDEMETMELIETVVSLRTLANELLDKLCEYCGKGDFCGNGCKECWADPGQFEPIRLPDWVLESAGISKDAKLLWEIDEEEHVIRLWYEEDAFDLDSIPPDILAYILERGFCLGELLESLVLGNIVYSQEPSASK